MPEMPVKTYQRSDFHFHLPPELIAQAPLPERGASRLLELRASDGSLHDRAFRDLPRLLAPGDVLVLNNTRVLPARLFGHKASGGKVEILLERMLDEQRALVQMKANRKPAEGGEIVLEGGGWAVVCGREDRFFVLRFELDEPLTDYLHRVGHMPLPPYIQREDAPEDRERYQTVFGRRDGAVAAPTAGLHFDEALLQQLADQGVRRAEVTLHVGAGTYQPVQTDDLEAHKMHSEWMELDEANCRLIREARAAGGRVVAVGTTAVRVLETAAQGGQLRPMSGETDIFIRPGYRFQAVDALLTNFHLPESTLIMLVAAFAGYERTMKAYRHAVEQGYRFFSYGDAMFLNGRYDHEI